MCEKKREKERDFNLMVKMKKEEDDKTEFEMESIYLCVSEELVLIGP